MGWTTGTDVDAVDPGAVAAGAELKRLGATRPASAMPPARARYRNRGSSDSCAATMPEMPVSRRSPARQGASDA
jgi:hypothetical protein